MHRVQSLFLPQDVSWFELYTGLYIIAKLADITESFVRKVVMVILTDGCTCIYKHVRFWGERKFIDCNSVGTVVPEIRRVLMSCLS